MKVEITISKDKKLPDGTAEALKQEFGHRLDARFPGCQLTARRAGSDGLTVFGGEPDEVSELLRETWESAEDWFH